VLRRPTLLKQAVGIVAQLRARGDEPEPCGTAELFLMAVAAEARRRGVGRALIEHSAAGLQAGGVRAYRVLLHADNEPANRLYAETGFVETRLFNFGGQPWRERELTLASDGDVPASGDSGPRPLPDLRPSIGALCPGGVGRAALRPRAGGWHRLALVGVLTLAAFLRFDGITRVGIRFDDEGAYALDARLWHRGAMLLTDPEAVRAVWHGDRPTLKRLKEVYRIDFGDRYAKPGQGYTFLGALVMSITGDAAGALPLTNALCGTLAVLVLYLIGSSSMGRTVGLGAALLLAVSPYHLVYCRSALSEAVSGLAVLTGVLCWTLGRTRGWSWRRTALLSGLAFGYAITCHHRTAYIPPLLLLADLLLEFQIRGTGRLWGASPASAGARVGWLALGAAIPILAVESIFQAARAAAALAGGGFSLTTYLPAWWAWVMADYAAGAGPAPNALWTLQVPAAYAAFFVHWHGLAAGVLALLGVVLVLRPKGPAKAPGLIVLGTLTVLLLQKHVVARALSTATPFLCLCVAVGWTQCAARPASRRALRVVWATALGLLVVVPAAAGAWRVSGQRSQLGEVCSFLAERQADVVAVPADVRKYRLYLDDYGIRTLGIRCRLTQPPDVLLAQLRSAGVRWVVTDPQYWHYITDEQSAGGHVAQRWQALGHELERNGTLAVEFPHLNTARWEFLAEANGTTCVAQMTAQGGGPLRVYDLGRAGGATADVRHIAAHRVAPPSASGARLDPQL
jgi:hypothetical protein